MASHSITRRRFIASVAGGGLYWALPNAAPAAPFPVHFRKSYPYESLLAFVEPGYDEFKGEQDAEHITALLEKLPQARSLPLGNGFRGVSPLPARYRHVAQGITEAEFNHEDTHFESGLTKWLDSLGKVRSARFYVLPDERVRYEIASSTPEGLQYRVGFWKQKWHDGRLTRCEPIEEVLVSSRRPLFQDITSTVFGGTGSFCGQLLQGVPFWRARLDSATGIDVYGNNGIAVGDVDGDGWDEIYVCQPGGLPNRLYKNRGDGTMEDITERAGVGVLDDTSCALFLDLRNIGRQDLVVATVHAPLLFLNQGNGIFRHKPDAFQFKSPAQGTFTGMAAADYDLDGRLDIYLCTYIYYQSEGQYRYPVPYYDSRNGPPNFLFHNELATGGEGCLKDVTASVGLDENNNRYSFAPAWCDYDGDGRPDLYVANDFGRSNLYKNTGGVFRDVAATAGVGRPGPGMSAAWFDYDGDGRPDLYVSNMWSANGQRIVADPGFRAAPDETLREAYRRHSQGNSLYRNRGDGTFEAREGPERADMGRWAWASDGIDFDNDGSPEIFITCGMLTNSSASDLAGFFWRQVVSRSPTDNAAAPTYEDGWNALNQLVREDYSWNGREPNVLYARRGNRFYDFSGVSGLDYAEDSRAFAVTDLDGDGTLDLLLKSRLGPQVRAFQNDWGDSQHSIAFELRGTRSNRDAVGARVEVEHSGGRSVGMLQAGSGYLSQHSKRLHFGLGTSTVADSVVVGWPSGLVQRFENLAGGSRHQIVEGSSEVSSIAFVLRRRRTEKREAVQGNNETRFEPTWLIDPVPLPDRRTGPGFLCLYSGKRPVVSSDIRFEAVDPDSARPEVAAWYALFRRYLFDYRTGLTLPLLLLIDERGLARKIYPDIPPDGVLRSDLRELGINEGGRRALPFSGRYYTPPRRDYFRFGAAFYWAGYPQQALPYFEQA